MANISVRIDEKMKKEMEQMRQVLASASSERSTDNDRTLMEYAEIEKKLEEINNSFWEEDITNQYDTTEYEPNQEEFISDFWKGKINEIT